MQSRGSWTAEQDQTLKSIVQSSNSVSQNENFDWQLISHTFRERLSLYKTPKQCSDRWNNHLKPRTGRQPEWTVDEQMQLFELQEKLGNRWTTIASFISNRTDSAIKNYFYATLRKAIRIINKFINQHRSEQFYKNFKTFPENCIGKIMAQQQNKKTNKMRVTKDNIADSAREIKSLLLEISRDCEGRDLIEQAIFEISEFNRNCRRLRSRKRKSSQDMCEDSQIQKLSPTEHSIKKARSLDQSKEVKVEQLHSMVLRQPNQSFQKNDSLSTLSELIFKEYCQKKSKAELDYNEKPIYMFDCSENMLLESRKEENRSKVLRQSTKNTSSQRAQVDSLFDQRKGDQQLGQQNDVQGIIQFSQEYFHIEQFGGNSELPYQNYLEPDEISEQIDEEYP